jgi:hypothetical protein
MQVNPFCELINVRVYLQKKFIKYKQYLTDSSTNLTFDTISGAVRVMQSVMPIMRKKGGGIIVT